MHNPGYFVLDGTFVFRWIAMRIFLVIGALLGFLGVAAGAFGTHGLRERLSPEMMNIFEIGVRYQMYHALALLAVGWLADRSPSLPVTLAGWLFIGGTVVFSGTLYVLSLTGVRGWGAVTPLGGLALLAGWACLMWTAWSIPR
jgi:uncharacterized membrane protein YgdD (TMEM256/DUF423 family)